MIIKPTLPESQVLGRAVQLLIYMPIELNVKIVSQTVQITTKKTLSNTTEKSFFSIFGRDSDWLHIQLE